MPDQPTPSAQRDRQREAIRERWLQVKAENEVLAAEVWRRLASVRARLDRMEELDRRRRWF